ncbi:DUF1496 domain-containing protein [Pseudoalteromonas sp. ZZD1]|uniref:DUF1496 domain-containing protein n=1 Tax=Pseudoalteromonas sp. ZZD1 TaxID=3139395 RepID=UPI003BABABFD
MRILNIIGICFVSLIYSVNSFSNTSEARLLLTPEDALTQHAICWYEDKRYSEGAIISLANVRLMCAAKNPNHNNSALRWLILNDKNEVIYPPRTKTIRVN